MLHTINKSPFQANSLESCLRFAQDQDPVLLIEDGVYAAQSGSKAEEMVKSSIGKNPIYALSGDLNARGVKRIIEGVTVIDYEGFVELVESHQVNTWL